MIHLLLRYYRYCLDRRPQRVFRWAEVVIAEVNGAAERADKLGARNRANTVSALIIIRRPLEPLTVTLIKTTAETIDHLALISKTVDKGHGVGRRIRASGGNHD